jgi:hypothetical protein
VCQTNSNARNHMQVKRFLLSGKISINLHKSDRPQESNCAKCWICLISLTNCIRFNCRGSECESSQKSRQISKKAYIWRFFSLRIWQWASKNHKFFMPSREWGMFVVSLFYRSASCGRFHTWVREKNSQLKRVCSIVRFSEPHPMRNLMVRVWKTRGNKKIPRFN